MIFCNVIITSEDTKMLKFNRYQNPDKPIFITYVDLECIIKKIYGCKNNPENPSKTIVGKNIPSEFSISTISSFTSIENKHNVYRGNNCMKTFFIFLKEHAMNINNFRKRKIKLLTKEQQESYENTKICYTSMDKFENKYLRDKNIVKLDITVIMQKNTEVLRIVYVT